MHFFVGQTASIRDIYIINISISCLSSLVSASRVLNSVIRTEVIRNTVKKTKSSLYPFLRQLLLKLSVKPIVNCYSCVCNDNGDPLPAGILFVLIKKSTPLLTVYISLWHPCSI